MMIRLTNMLKNTMKNTLTRKMALLAATAAGITGLAPMTAQALAARSVNVTTKALPGPLQ